MPDDAQDMFRKGDRVRMTLACPRKATDVTEHGIVVGFGRLPWFVRVRRDGVKHAERFHVHFWERANA